MRLGEMMPIFKSLGGLSLVFFMGNLGSITLS